MLISDWSSDVCSSDLGFEPFWVVTKHADVLEVTRRNDLYDSTTKPFILGEIEAIERMRAINDGDAFPFKSLTGTDEPEHGVLRKLFTPLFQNQGMKAMEPRVRAIARAHVDGMAALGGRCDFVNDIALEIGRASCRERVCQYV